MKKQWKLFTTCITLLLLVVSLWASDSSKDAVTITVLQTSDLHGVIMPWRYRTASEFDGGLAKVATIVKQEREKDPDLLLVDSGDTIDGNRIKMFRYDDIHPMVKAMNAMDFDAWILGNHEFSFEFKTLLSAIEKSDAEVLAGNIYKENGERFVKPYVIKEIDGVKIGIIGLTTPLWGTSNPERSNYMTFFSPEEELVKILDEIEGKADVLIVVAHYGPDGEFEAAGMREIANKYGDRVDAFLIGHAHTTITETLPNGTIILEPGFWGTAVSKLVLNMEKIDNEWIVSSKSGEIIPIEGEGIAVDPELTEIMNYVHERFILVFILLGVIGLAVIAVIIGFTIKLVIKFCLKKSNKRQNNNSLL